MAQAVSSAEPVDELSAVLQARVLQAIAQAGGWLPFDRYMAMALYEPGLGYYARQPSPFGAWPGAGRNGGRGGSDFITAPELSPLFGAALARQVGQALALAQLEEVIEFGAGSGALAEQVLDALATLGHPRVRYTIVELSGPLHARQRERLQRFGERVRWLAAWPERIDAVVIGNEVLDAMPAKLLHFDGQRWWERGVAAAGRPGAAEGAATASANAMPAHGARPAVPAERPLAWADRPTALRPPLAERALPGAVLEIHPQADAFVRSLAERLTRGAAFFIDYGFPEAEYYHPQRHQGTLMCHRAHRSDTEPLVEPGSKDITVHVDFTAMALAAQEAGAEVVGYATQARFLMNCGLLELAEGADVRARAAAQKLLTEHEMGELYKVLAFSRGVAWPQPGPGAAGGPLGFASGDRTHTL